MIMNRTLKSEDVIAAVVNIRAIATSEHGSCPEDYTTGRLTIAIYEDGKIPTQEEQTWLVMGKEDDEGASVPEWLAEKYPHLNAVLAAIY